MITIWGRSSSFNVQKVLWCCDELGLSYERHDAGMEHGVTREPWYLAMNPNGLVPTVKDGDLILWESNSVMRYLADCYGGAGLYPPEPARRHLVERWLDWQLSTIGPAIRPVFWGLVRTPEDKRDMAAITAATHKLAELWALLDRELAGRPFVGGTSLSIADIALGPLARRWYGMALPVERPDLPSLAQWHRRLEQRPGYQAHLMRPIV